MGLLILLVATVGTIELSWGLNKTALKRSWSTKVIGAIGGTSFFVALMATAALQLVNQSTPVLNIGLYFIAEFAAAMSVSLIAMIIMLKRGYKDTLWFFAEFNSATEFFIFLSFASKE